MTEERFIEAVIQAYCDLLAAAMPVTFFIAGCNLIFNTVVNAFTKGILTFGGRQ